MKIRNKKWFIVFGLFLSVFLVTAHTCMADVYTIDSVHSSIGFAIKHMTVSTTRGEFTDYTGTITFDPADIPGTEIDITIQAASIDTRQEARDKHLRSPDFFDTENYPTITFNNVEVKGAADTATLSGDLTMHGVTKRIAIPAEISGPVMNHKGKRVIGISGQVTVNRQDFGISFNKILDTGGLVVGNKVKIQIEVEAN